MNSKLLVLTIYFVSFFGCCEESTKQKVNLPTTQPIKSSARTGLTVANSIGQSASDFSYLTSKGKIRKMSMIHSKMTLLFFYNPECEACKEYKAILATSVTINQKIKSGTLSILALYIDKDPSLWIRHLPEMPKNWIHGRDNNEYLYKNNIYDLHAIPTIYLLDKNKKVILKDVLDVRMIEKALIK